MTKTTYHALLTALLIKLKSLLTETPKHTHLLMGRDIDPSLQKACKWIPLSSLMLDKFTAAELVEGLFAAPLQEMAEQINQSGRVATYVLELPLSVSVAERVQDEDFGMRLVVGHDMTIGQVCRIDVLYAPYSQAEAAGHFRTLAA